MARKDILMLGGVGLVFSYISTVPDFHYIARAFAFSWLFFYCAGYIFYEGKNSVAFPILVRFYYKIAKMEVNNL
jgi:hypothetical protein